MNPEHKESGADFLIRTFLEKYAQLAVKEAREQDIEEMEENVNKKDKINTVEVGNLIADAIIGKMSRQTAKEGSPFDKNRKQIIKEVSENIYGEHTWKANVDDMLRIFKSGMEYSISIVKSKLEGGE
jgi:hypothetical protein